MSTTTTTPQSLKRRRLQQSQDELPPASTASPSTALTKQGAFALPSEFHQQMLDRLNPSPPFPVVLVRPHATVEFFLRAEALEAYFNFRQSLELRPIGRPFVRSAAPNIPIHVYLERLFKYCQPEPVILLSLVAYTERLAAASSTFIPANGLHRWIVAGWLVAGKAMNGDQFWTNAFWARVAGISVTELMALEVEFVRLFDWNVQVSVAELAQSYQLLLDLLPSSDWDRLK